jgi:acetyl esterase/lipase
MRLLDLARLLMGTFLFATASLAVVTAPTHFLWMAAVGVTELGHMLALICLGVAVALWSDSWSGRVAVGLSVAAAIVALTPVLRATRVARDLPNQLRAAFGDAVPTRPSPLVFGDLFRGISSPEVQAEKFVYTNIEDEELSFDFYRAQAPGSAPVVVVVHGGSWQSGDNKDFIPMDRYLASRGFAVADVIYRLAPRWTFPAAQDDARAAIAFLRSRADVLKIDPNRIVLLGRSAGAQIALTVAYSAKDPGIRGVISFYAPSDLHWSWEHPGNPLVIDTRAVLTAYLGGNPSEASSNYDAASPIRFVTSAVPPTLLLHGGRDELVSSYQSSRLTERLAEAGVRHLNVELPWATHGFDFIFRGPGGQISTYAIEYFLACVTRDQA